MPSWQPAVLSCQCPGSSLQATGVMRRRHMYGASGQWQPTEVRPPSTPHQRHPPPPPTDALYQAIENRNRGEPGFEGLEGLLSCRHPPEGHFGGGEGCEREQAQGCSCWWNNDRSWRTLGSMAAAYGSWGQARRWQLKPFLGSFACYPVWQRTPGKTENEWNSDFSALT